MDLLTVFGISFALFSIALYCYWVFLKRAKLLEKAQSLREEHLASTVVPGTPRNPDNGKPIPFSPFPSSSIPIKTEDRD
jgi:hypothetical protein